MRQRHGFTMALVLWIIAIISFCQIFEYPSECTVQIVGWLLIGLAQSLAAFMMLQPEGGR